VKFTIMSAGERTLTIGQHLAKLRQKKRCPVFRFTVYVSAVSRSHNKLCSTDTSPRFVTNV